MILQHCKKLSEKISKKYLQMKIYKETAALLVKEAWYDLHVQAEKERNNGGKYGDVYHATAVRYRVFSVERTVSLMLRAAGFDSEEIETIINNSRPE